MGALSLIAYRYHTRSACLLVQYTGDVRQALEGESEGSSFWVHAGGSELL